MPRRPPMDALCRSIEGYFTALQQAKLPGLELSPEVLKPQSPAALARLEKQLGARLPADLRAFLARGLRGLRGWVDADGEHASLGFDFLDAKGIAEHTLMLRKVAAETIDDPDDAHAALVRAGLALTFEEPELLLSGGLHHFSFRNPPLRVAGSFGEFLQHWLASGCFSAGRFDLLWRQVRPLVPSKVTPAKNLWVRAYRKQFPGSFA